MSLLTLLLTLIVIGTLVWFVNFSPSAAASTSTKKYFNSIMAIAVAILFLYGFGVIGHVNTALPDMK